MLIDAEFHFSGQVVNQMASEIIIIHCNTIPYTNDISRVGVQVVGLPPESASAHTAAKWCSNCLMSSWESTCSGKTSRECLADR